MTPLGVNGAMPISINRVITGIITRVIFEKFEIALVLLGQFQNFQKCTRTIYPKSPSQPCDYQY